jgi:hypothetical protein
VGADVRIRVADFKVFTSETHRTDGTKTVEHLYVIRDTDGRLHERFSSDPDGKWVTVPLPERQERKRRAKK